MILIKEQKPQGSLPEYRQSVLTLLHSFQILPDYLTALSAERQALIQLSTTNNTGSILVPNDKLLEKVGLTTDEIEEDPNNWIEHIHPDDRIRVLHEINDYQKSNGQHISYYRMLNPKDNTTVWIKDTTDDVNIGGIIFKQTIIEDITEVIEEKEFSRAIVKALNEIYSHHELPKVINTISIEMKHIVPCDSGSLMFFENDELVDISYWNIQSNGVKKSEKFDELRERVKGMKNIQHVLNTGKLKYIPDTEIPNSEYATNEYSQGVKSYIGIPLIVDGKVIGIMNISSKSIHYDTKQLARAREFALAISQAIENARLHEEILQLNKQLAEQARTDSLTGLRIRRGLEPQIAQQIERTKRTGNPFSLLMLDLDKFKVFNDTFGHLKGDSLLAKIGEKLKKIRDIDSAFRFGGEEFIIILEGDDAVSAIMTALRIQQAINGLPQEVTNETIPINSETGLPVGSSFSIGIVTFNKKDERHIESLIEIADNTMYLAKNNGRNQIRHELYPDIKIQSLDDFTNLTPQG